MIDELMKKVGQQKSQLEEQENQIVQLDEKHSQEVEKLQYEVGSTFL